MGFAKDDSVAAFMLGIWLGVSANWAHLEEQRPPHQGRVAASPDLAGLMASQTNYFSYTSIINRTISFT